MAGEAKNEKAPRYTIITPTWNQVEFIGETIESVIRQSIRDLEYLIIDNCSDDGTEELVRSYAEKDERIVYLREKDHGQAEAINKGLKRARGEIVCWINSDDYYTDHEVLAKVDEIFRDRTDAGVVIGDAWYSDKNGQLTDYNAGNRHVPDWVLRRWYYIVQPAVFWKNRGALLDESYHYAFDWKFFIHETKAQGVYYSDEAYAVYRMYEENKTGQNNAARRREVLRLQEELGDSRMNIAWCRHVLRVYEKAEAQGNENAKKWVDFWSKVLFHLSGKRIVGF